jgi:hypothetical protein
MHYRCLYGDAEILIRDEAFPTRRSFGGFEYDSIKNSPSSELILTLGRVVASLDSESPLKSLKENIDVQHERVKNCIANIRAEGDPQTDLI